MVGKASKSKRNQHRRYDEEFKEQAVRMMLDGQSAASVSDRLGLSGANLLYRWRRKLLKSEGALAGDLDSKVGQLQEQVRLLERERDVLKKALAIFSRNG